MPAQRGLCGGTIRGGTATNIIPAHCEIEWEMRPVPAVDDAALDRALADLEGGAGGVRVEHEALARVPALAHDLNRAAADRLGRILGDDRRETRPFVTEAGIFQAAGIPAVVCGPGNVEQAHQPDEFVAISDLDAYTPLLDELIAALKHDGD